MDSFTALKQQVRDVFVHSLAHSLIQLSPSRHQAQGIQRDPARQGLAEEAQVSRGQARAGRSCGATGLGAELTPGCV